MHVIKTEMEPLKTCTRTKHVTDSGTPSPPTRICSAIAERICSRCRSLPGTPYPHSRATIVARVWTKASSIIPNQPCSRHKLHMGIAYRSESSLFTMLLPDFAADTPQPPALTSLQLRDALCKSSFQKLAGLG
jgi:hypothetical protein